MWFKPQPSSNTEAQDNEDTALPIASCAATKSAKMDQRMTLTWGLCYTALVALCWRHGVTEAEGKPEDPFPSHPSFLVLSLEGAVSTIIPEAPRTPAAPAIVSSLFFPVSLIFFLSFRIPLVPLFPVLHVPAHPCLALEHPV